MDGFRSDGAGGADWDAAEPVDQAGGLFMVGDPSFVRAYAERTVGEAVVTDLRAAPFLLREKTAFVRATAPRIMLHAIVDGRPTYHNGHGEQSALAPGHLVIRRADDAAVVRCDHFARVVTLTVARHLLVPHYATAEALEEYVIEMGASLPQRLLYSFIVGLVDDQGSGELSSRMSIVDALGGLVSMNLAQRPRPSAHLSERAAARSDEVLRYLRLNFANPHLTPSTIAEELYISVRYAHKLMQMTGRSFREELIRLRLEAARLAFAANSRPRQTIADIAISVGFNDLSQFNRHFRTAFGMTPRAARRLDEANGFEPAAGGDGAWDGPALGPDDGAGGAMAGDAASRTL
jgi:AraC-like DNA-binding protein